MYCKNCCLIMYNEEREHYYCQCGNVDINADAISEEEIAEIEETIRKQQLLQEEE